MPAAKVKVIREGYFRWTEKPAACEASGTVTLVEDGGKRILVDAGGFGEEGELISALKATGLAPDDIDIVVLTHPHPDHVGGAHLFAKAEFVGAGVRWRGPSYRFWSGDALPLTDDVYVLRTPGHTDECCSVIAGTADGVTAVVGDLWYRAGDRGLMIAADREKLAESRRKILDLADHLIPGHQGLVPAQEAKS